MQLPIEGFGLTARSGRRAGIALLAGFNVKQSFRRPAWGEGDRQRLPGLRSREAGDPWLKGAKRSATRDWRDLLRSRCGLLGAFKWRASDHPN